MNLKCTSRIVSNFNFFTVNSFALYCIAVYCIVMYCIVRGVSIVSNVFSSAFKKQIKINKQINK